MSSISGHQTELAQQTQAVFGAHMLDKFPVLHTGVVGASEAKGTPIARQHGAEVVRISNFDCEKSVWRSALAFKIARPARRRTRPRRRIRRSIL
jgi:hypothetical protein